MKKSMRRNLIEWGILIVVGLTLYGTGWYVEVFGRMQQVLLMTGFKQPGNVIDLTKRDSVTSNWQLVGMANDTSIRLADLKGKVVFINFWASWCPPCVAEMPNIHSLYTDMDPEEVVFAMVSLDRDPELARAFIRQRDYTFPTYFPAMNLPDQFDVTSIPTTYILDKNGRIAIVEEGLADYDNASFRAQSYLFG
jgi:thiol-disulfide isomerase/thioredoxin